MSLFISELSFFNLIAFLYLRLDRAIIGYRHMQIIHNLNSTAPKKIEIFSYCIENFYFSSSMSSHTCETLRL